MFMNLTQKLCEKLTQQQRTRTLIVCTGRESMLRSQTFNVRKSRAIMYRPSGENLISEMEAMISEKKLQAFGSSRSS